MPSGRPKGSKNTNIKTETKKKTCNNCKRELTLNNFYSSSSPMFDGKTPLCKKCIKELINYDDMKTIYSVLQTMDIAFLYDVWETVKGKKGDTFGNYMRMMNSLPQYNSLRWDNSSFEENNINNNTNNSECECEEDFKDFKITQDIIKKWGKGYSKEQYAILEDIYEDMCMDFTIDNRSQEEYLRTACLYQMMNKEAIASGNAAEAQKWGQMFDKYMESGKLKPNQINPLDAMGNISCFSEFFEFVEKQGFVPKFPDVILDDLDYAIYCFINYNRELAGQPPIQLGKVKDIMTYDFISGQEVIVPKVEVSDING